MKEAPIHFQQLAAQEQNDVSGKNEWFRYGFSSRVSAGRNNVERDGQWLHKATALHQPKWHAGADWLLFRIPARPDISLRQGQVELLAERVDV